MREIMHENEVDGVLDRIDNELKGRLLENLGKAVQETLEQSLATITLLPIVNGMIHIANEPEAVLRIETLYLLIDSLSSYVPKQQLDSALRRTGNIIGRSFAYTLIEMYNETHVCTYDSFIEFWSRIDKRYGWGDIRVVKKNESNGAPTCIEIKNGFLARESHKRCSFMEGYIRGLIDESFRYIAFELEQEFKMHLNPRVQVDSVKESRSSDHCCIFDLVYSPVKYKEAYDYLFRCRTNITSREYGSYYKYLRICLEYALKEMVELKPKSRIPVHRIIQEMNRLNANVFDTSQAKMIYEICNKDLHMDKRDSDKATMQYFATSILLNDICNNKLSARSRKKIVNCLQSKDNS